MNRYHLKSWMGIVALVAIVAGIITFTAAPIAEARVEAPNASVAVSPSQQAEPGLYLVNQTDTETIYTAVAFYDWQEDDWISSGWYVLGPGGMSQPLTGDLNSPYYYVFGVSAQYYWGGESYGWVHDDPFTIHQSRPPAGSYKVPFAEFSVEKDITTATWNFR
jgi:uncharacterized membrane protein